MGAERLYTVYETFDLLKSYKITSNIESVRRYLRQGELEGIAPTSRKDGWKVTQAVLDCFLAKRLPESALSNDGIFNATNDVNGTRELTLDEEAVRAKMWYQIASKNIWERSKYLMRFVSMCRKRFNLIKIL